MPVFTKAPGNCSRCSCDDNLYVVTIGKGSKSIKCSRCLKPERYDTIAKIRPTWTEQMLAKFPWKANESESWEYGCAESRCNCTRNLWICFKKGERAKFRCLLHRLNAELEFDMVMKESTTWETEDLVESGVVEDLFKVELEDLLANAEKEKTQSQRNKYVKSMKSLSRRLKTQAKRAKKIAKKIENMPLPKSKVLAQLDKELAAIDNAK